MSLVDLSFPPLLRGEAAAAGVDPFAQAISRAALGCEPGLIVHNEGGGVLIAALILAPDARLEDAMAMTFACGLGLADALGALAPPEVGVHLEWPDGVRVNGARCGRIRAAASTSDADETPDWLVVGFELRLSSPEDAEPGADPDATTLYDEGCADIEPYRLLESWSRHSLVWINHWLDDGMARLHPDWRSRAHRLGEETTATVAGAPVSGAFVGLDEQGGMLLRSGEDTRLIPLSSLLEV